MKALQAESQALHLQLQELCARHGDERAAWEQCQEAWEAERQEWVAKEAEWERKLVAELQASGEKERMWAEECAKVGGPL